MEKTLAKHTAGPWEVSRDGVPDYHAQFTVYAEQNGERVATAFISDANARLIAAAPELLSAAKDALESLKRLTDTDGAYRVTNITQLQNAIRKATA